MSNIQDIENDEWSDGSFQGTVPKLTIDDSKASIPGGRKKRRRKSRRKSRKSKRKSRKGKKKRKTRRKKRSRRRRR